VASEKKRVEEKHSKHIAHVARNENEIRVMMMGKGKKN